MTTSRKNLLSYSILIKEVEQNCWGFEQMDAYSRIISLKDSKIFEKLTMAEISMLLWPNSQQL